MQRTSVAGRIEALDYLRGFFILVIIVDHLWRWPNLFEYVSGRGELWVSAAEGFVMISGLLVGYVRGHKGLKKSFGEISKKLITRGLMLYIWAFITTILLVAATWMLTFRSGLAYVPIQKFDWYDLIVKNLTLQYTHTLSHFLYLYAIFLVATPLFIWLLRRKQWWLGAIISIAIFVLGYIWKVEAMQWQLLFFLPAIAGFYLNEIIAACRRIPSWVTWTVVGIGVATILWSAMVVLPIDAGWYHTKLFAREPLAPARLGLAALWFVTGIFLFNRCLKWLERSVGWLLMPFGTRSLTAYIVHSLPLMLIAFFIPPTESFILNTLITICAILATWAILKIPNINKVVPQ